MIRPIYLYGNPVLRKIAQEVDRNDETLAQLINDMKETMYDSEGIGIAAPQIGVSKRVIYIDVDILKDDFPELKDVRLTLINPKLTVDETSPTESREEGCLSVPKINEKVTRHTKVRLQYVDEQWNEHDEVIEGYLARVIQHEYDHLEGLMFIDHISAVRKQMIRGKLNNMITGKVNCRYRFKAAKPARGR